MVGVYGDLCLNVSFKTYTVEVLTGDLCSNVSVKKYTVEVLTGDLCSNVSVKKYTVEVLTEDFSCNVSVKKYTVEVLTGDLCFNFSVKKYTVEVFTGDKSGAGTDAKVFLIMFGDRWQSKEIKLHQSETNRNKFERGKVSLNMAALVLTWQGEFESDTVCFDMTE